MAELAVEGKELHTEVANQLRRYVCQIDIPSMRVYALLHLASIKGMATKLAMEALQDALAAWREIEDLKLKLRTGYEFVKLAAPLDKEFARSLLLKVQELNCLSGAPLASGSLGATYAEFIRLGLRSLTEVDLQQDRRFIDQYLDLIEKLPSPYVKLELFGMLASALLRCNHNREATDIVRYKLLPLLTSKACDPAAGQAIAEVLPVVYDFDPDMAAQVCGTLPRETRSNAWLSVILWLLSHCFLNDQEKIDISRLNLSATYRCLKECADITAKIEHDIIVSTAVETISRCVKTSLDSQSIEARPSTGYPGKA